MNNWLYRLVVMTSWYEYHNQFLDDIQGPDIGEMLIQRRIKAIEALKAQQTVLIV
jgi:hypothetical protein